LKYELEDIQIPNGRILTSYLLVKTAEEIEEDIENCDNVIKYTA
jgi:hypothetical protein